MKAFKCEMCGGSDVVKQDGFFVCQSCGIKYTPDEAKKLMIEVSGKIDISGSTVKIDESDKLKNLIAAARTATECKHYSDAAQKWSQIQSREPENWEACFFSTLCDSLVDTWGGIDYNPIHSTIRRSVELINSNLENEADQSKALEKICASIDLVIIPNLSYWSFRDNSDANYRSLMGEENTYSSYTRRTNTDIKKSQSAQLYAAFGDLIQTTFPSAPDCLKVAVNAYGNASYYYSSSTYSNNINMLKNKIDEIVRKRRDAERKEKRDAFWAAHPDEKKELLLEISSLDSREKELRNQIDQQKRLLEGEKDSIPEKRESWRLEIEIKKTLREKSGLGIFDYARKQELAALIEDLDAKKQEVDNQISERIRMIDSEIRNLETGSASKELAYIEERILRISELLECGELEDNNNNKVLSFIEQQEKEMKTYNEQFESGELTADEYSI